MAKKSLISINIFPSLDAAEIIYLSNKDGNVEKAESLPVAFDPNSRQIADVDQMSQVLKDLYETNGISPNSPTVLVLPSYFTRELEISSDFSEEEIRLSLTSEAERFYIFKKQEPQVCWLRLDESRVLYSAFPQAEIEKFTQIFQEMRTPLVGIELNYFSMLRGLVVTGTILEQIAISQKWGLLVVSDNAVFVALMEGQQILKADESPLSVGIEDNATTTDEILQDFQRFVANIDINKLVLVNNSDRINTDSLVSSLSSHGEVVIMEQNANTLASREAKEGLFPCSLEALGGAFYSQFPEMPVVNFLPETGEDLVTILNNQEKAFKGLVIANIAAVVLCLVLFGALTLFTWFKEGALGQLTESIASFETVANVPFQRGLFVKNAIEQNVRANDLLVHLGHLTGPEMWLSEISITNDVERKNTAVEIQGGATSTQPVDTLNNQLSEILNWKALRVGDVEQSFVEDGRSFFTWVIKTEEPKAGGGS